MGRNGDLVITQDIGVIQAKTNCSAHTQVFSSTQPTPRQCDSEACFGQSFVTGDLDNTPAVMYNMCKEKDIKSLPFSAHEKAREAGFSFVPNLQNQWQNPHIPANK
jgi:hypothetical protein